MDAATHRDPGPALRANWAENHAHRRSRISLGHIKGTVADPEVDLGEFLTDLNLVISQGIAMRPLVAS